jgi:hypothetical protein
MLRNYTKEKEQAGSYFFYFTGSLTITITGMFLGLSGKKQQRNCQL